MKAKRDILVRGLPWVLSITVLALSRALCPAQSLEQPVRMTFQGPMGERFEANLEQWLLQAPYANPGMLEMYFLRNQPHQKIVTWYGEFSGKYLTSASLAYAMQPDERLKETAALNHRRNDF